MLCNQGEAGRRVRLVFDNDGDKPISRTRWSAPALILKEGKL
ncbi:hypothetical protein Dhaf_1697 [Desulfitobacterium hafniense DCB-2]|uniref:Uncharacterized protein n=2 Tax=Desulfitobacterium hafniense TaxID=49338 RepID=G9XIX4_DESHA|nr:hypothetical protein Dhaf_1697 [Desulfitobacterium hafniense DCB-2]EHL08402.1 hypothetical protein HMPREF0322_00900 [Desulfitobacterium hafniense DP7]